MMMTYPGEKHLIESNMVSFNVFKSILSTKVRVFFQHLSDSFFFAMVVIGTKLDLGETDKLSSSHMSTKGSLESKQALKPHLVVIGIVYRDPSVALPYEEGLGDFGAALPS